MNELLVKYESLLNEIASLEKECSFIYIDYIKEFGDEINHIFSLKVESIALKKKIAYCIKKQNRNEEIVLEKMEKDVDTLMANYKSQLKEMIALKKNVDGDKGVKISFDVKKRIKTMYYKIVHMIHPDLHPELANDKTINKLWQQCVDAYKRNDEKLLKRVYDHVLLVVDSSKEIVLENVEEKIYVIEQEIKEIKENNPYKYKYILEDEDEKLSLHKTYKEEEEHYLDYVKQLAKELSSFFNEEKKCDA